MKNRIILSVLVLVFLSFSAFAQKNKIQIIETGEFHGDEITAETGEMWLGLYAQGENYSLLPSVLTIETVHDQIVDAADEKTGKSVKILGQPKPIFLIKGDGFVQSRTIKTVFDGEKSIGNNFDETFIFQGKSYRLYVETENPKNTKSEMVDETSKLVLTSGNIKQIIYSQKNCDDCGWSLQWVGDLDDDGKLDFYADVSDHYNASHRRLFLSSKAGNNELVKEAAEFVTVGC
jgi:hypothetical protein